MSIMDSTLDLVIIGGGPAGLACAIHARRQNLNFQLIEKGCFRGLQIFPHLVNSLRGKSEICETANP